MGKLKEVFTNWKVILLLVFLFFSLLVIRPQIFGNDGVSIRSVAHNSSAANAGIENPSSKLTPLAKEKIISINGEKVSSIADYFNALDLLVPNQTVKVETDNGFYSLLPVLNQDGVIDLGLTVYDAPLSNLRKGLDLEGGSRVLLKPVEQISQDDLEITIANLKERLNVYGLSDVNIRASSDLTGEDYILIEIAGVTENEVKELIAKQGKFEAKIANDTVFSGGKRDITYVCRSAECSGIDPNRACSKLSDGSYGCTFFFSITLSQEAAERQAALTAPLEISREDNNEYLSADLILYLDDTEVDSLKIGADLQGRAVTDIQISGSGQGRTDQEAVTNTLQNMKRLQTIIISGSLPTKLEVVKIDTISASLGKEFLNNIFFVGVLVLIVVSAVILIRYRNLKVVGPIVLTLISELIMILGFAALVGWNLDLAAVAGIIIVAGTGVDHLVIITDESLKGEFIYDWKKKIKNAMFIIIGAYFTTVAGMLPLLWAGAGLLKGFALTTIAGTSFGVLIARPAYAAVVEILLKK